MNLIRQINEALREDRIVSTNEAGRGFHGEMLGSYWHLGNHGADQVFDEVGRMLVAQGIAADGIEAAMALDSRAGRHFADAMTYHHTPHEGREHITDKDVRDVINAAAALLSLEGKSWAGTLRRGIADSKRYLSESINGGEATADNLWDQLVEKAEAAEAEGSDRTIPDIVDFFAEVLNGGVEQWEHNISRGTNIRRLIANLISCGPATRDLGLALEAWKEGTEDGAAEEIERILYNQDVARGIYLEVLALD